MNWYCIRSQPKHEHIAAGHLRQEAGLEVYLPRIRFRKPTREGPVWFTEALFPNYLFVRFDMTTAMRLVQHTRGVSAIVHFGDQYPAVPDGVIAELRATVSSDRVHVIEEQLEPGSQVVISGGSFDHFRAIVTRVMSAKDRVAVLLDFLGRQTEVELSREAVLIEGEARSKLERH
jgi:Transcription antiterminator